MENKKLGSYSQVMCHNHKRKCDFFCSAESCNKAICKECVMSHTCPDVSTLEEYVMDKLELISRTTADMHKCRTSLSDHMDLGPALLRELDALQGSNCHKIQQHAQVLQALIKKRAQHLVKETQQTFDKERQARQTTSTKLSQVVSKLDAALEEIQTTRMDGLYDVISAAETASVQLTRLKAEVGIIVKKTINSKPPPVFSPPASAEFSPLVDALFEQGTCTVETNVGNACPPYSHNEHGNVGVIKPEKNKNIEKESALQVLTKFKVTCVRGSNPDAMCLGAGDCLAIVTSSRRTIQLFSVKGDLEWKTEYVCREALTTLAWYDCKACFLLVFRKVKFYTVTLKGVVSLAVDFMAELLQLGHDVTSVSVLGNGELVSLSQHGSSTQRAKISIWEKSGRQCLTTWDIFTAVEGMAAHRDLVLVSRMTAGEVWAYTVNGSVQWKFRPDMMCPRPFSPGHICTDHVGRIFVSDSDKQVVHVLSKYGTCKTHIEIEGNGPFLISADEDGHVVVMDCLSKQVQTMKCDPYIASS